MVPLTQASTLGDSIVTLLDQRVEEDADHPYLDFAGKIYSYGDVWQRATEVAGGLAAAGVKPGETVLSLTDNHIDGVATWFGTNMLGAIWVGANTALRGSFLQHVVHDAGARVVICEKDLVQRLVAVEGGIPDVSLVLHREELDEPIASRMAIEPLNHHRTPLDSHPVRQTADDLTCLIYTGGTTGPSKGCMISHGYALHLGWGAIALTGRTGDDVLWSPLPMYHLNVLGMTILGSMLVGGVGVVAKRFSVSEFWKEMERTGATVAILMGAMPVMLAQQPDTPESTRCFGQIRALASVPFPPALQQMWRDRFGVKFPGAKAYGLTEAFPVATLPVGADAPASCAGRPNSEDFDVQIVDDNDQPVPTGEVGEVVCRPHRSNVMFKGYWRRPEATVEATKNLWLHTGDLGRVDEDGFFYFVDRKQDYLRRRGENISSQEMEAAYLQHPEIEQVAVHAVPSELTEDDVKVTAVLTASSELTEENLFEWSKERIPYFALPRYIEFRAELPVSPLGRVHKYKLRDDGCTPETWDREAAGVSWERR